MHPCSRCPPPSCFSSPASSPASLTSHCSQLTPSQARHPGVRGRDPAATTIPSAPKLPLATHPDQRLPTSASSLTPSLLCPLPFRPPLLRLLALLTPWRCLHMRPLQRPPAIPSQPRPSSPTREKIRPSCLSPARPLLGVGLARDSSPFTPTQLPPPSHPPSAPPDPRPQLPRAAQQPIQAVAPPPSQDPAHPVPHPGPSVAGPARKRPRCSRKTPRRASRVF